MSKNKTMILTEISNELVRKLPYKNTWDNLEEYHLHELGDVYSVRLRNFSNMGVDEKTFIKNVRAKRYCGVIKE